METNNGQHLKRKVTFILRELDLTVFIINGHNLNKLRYPDCSVGGKFRSQSTKHSKLAKDSVKKELTLNYKNTERIVLIKGDHSKFELQTTDIRIK